MEFDEDDSINSILTEIESTLHTDYSSFGGSENEVVNAYHDDLRTVGYGRKDMEPFLSYNNPFDPRLTFNGLGEHIHHPDITNEKYKSELTQNVFLALENPSQLMDKYLNGYRAYVRGLCSSPASGDSTSVESRRLFERISSDSVRSIWSDTPPETTEIQASNDTEKVSQKSDDKTDVSVRPNIQKTRLAMRNKKKDDSIVPTERSQRIHASSPSSISPTPENTLKSEPKPFHTETKSKSVKIPKNDSWAGLFKKKNEKELSYNDDSQLSKENITGSQQGDHKIDQCETRVFKVQENQVNQERTGIHAHSIFTYPEYIEPTITPNNAGPSTHPQTHGNNLQPPVNNWSQSQDSINRVHQPFWTNTATLLQQQPCGVNQYQQPVDYNKPQTTYTQTVYTHIPPPPPGFSQAPTQNLQQPVHQIVPPNSCQEQLFAGSYSDQNSLIYNLHKYLQPPAQIQVNQPNRYACYQNQAKTHYGYQGNGNWNANNNNDYDGYGEDKPGVYYSHKSMENKGYEDQPTRDQKERPRCKTRNIRSNLIRIYPSKD